MDSSSGASVDPESVDDVLWELARAPPVPVPAAGLFVPGTLVDGRLVIRRQIGAGGMGMVFLAHHDRLDREVALKLTRAGATEAATARLQREARAMAQIVHTNVVTVYDVGLVDGYLYIAMEYLDGGTARSFVQGEKRSWEEVVHLYVQAGRGLAAAHAATLVHRDFKPDNVLLGRDGRVRVADFGLVRGASDTLGDPPSSPHLDHTVSVDPHPGEEDATTLTQTGARLGTPAYMAPEQHLGRTAGPASDQFSFCVSLWEALFGERPFADGRTWDGGVGDHKALTPPPNRSEVPRWVVGALQRGLQADPAQRHASMQQLLDVLSRDGSQRRRRGLVGLGLVATTAAVTWAVTPSVERVDPCASHDTGMEEVWNEARAAEVTEALTANGAAQAGISARVVEPIEAYARSWVAQARSACEATHVERTQSPEEFALRMRCLERRRTEVGALVDLLRRGDSAANHAAPSAVAKLSPLERCVDPGPLGNVEPVDPQDADRVRAADDELVRINELFDAGQYPQALAALDDLQPELERLGYDHLHSIALRIRGVSEVRMHRVADATLHLRSALSHAVAARQDDEARAVLEQMIYVDGYQRGEYELAREWARQARAWGRRAGDDPAAELSRLVMLSLVDREEGRLDDAVARIEEAMAIAARVEDDRWASLRLYSVMAEHQRFRGDVTAAWRAVNHALGLAATLYGERHPEYGRYLINAGASAQLAGDLDTARDYFQRGAALRSAALGEGDLIALEGRLNLGLLETQAGDPTAGERQMAQAIEVAQRTDAPPSRVVQMRGAHSAALIELGRLREAATQLRLVIDAERDLLGPSHPHRLMMLVNLVGVHTDLQEHAAALALGREGLELLPPGGDVRTAAVLHELLGTNLGATEGCAAAIVHFERAVSLLADLEGPQRASLVVGPALAAADCSVELGRPGKAADHIELVRALQLRDPGIVARLDALDARLR